jgi:hypothetical protein
MLSSNDGRNGWNRVYATIAASGIDLAVLKLVRILGNYNHYDTDNLSAIIPLSEVFLRVYVPPMLFSEASC